MCALLIWRPLEIHFGMQVLQAWGGITEHAKQQRFAANYLQQRRMRKALQGFFGSWAAHAERMRERRQVAGAHGDIVVRRHEQTCAQMSLLVSTLYCLHP